MQTKTLAERRFLPNTSVSAATFHVDTERVATVGWVNRSDDAKGAATQKLSVFDFAGTLLKEVSYAGRNNVSWNACAFSADGNFFAAAASTIQVFETAKWKKVRSHKLKGEVQRLAFADDGRLVASTLSESLAFSAAGEPLSDVSSDLQDRLRLARPTTWTTGETPVHWDAGTPPGGTAHLCAARAWGLELFDGEGGLLAQSAGPCGVVRALREVDGELQCYPYDSARWIPVAALAQGTKEAVLAAGSKSSLEAARTVVETDLGTLRVRNSDGVLELATTKPGQSASERVRYPRSDLSAFELDAQGTLVAAFGKGEIVVFDGFSANVLATLTLDKKQSGVVTAIHRMEDRRVAFALESGRIGVTVEPLL